MLIKIYYILSPKEEGGTAQENTFYYHLCTYNSRGINSEAVPVISLW